ncbi:MULTISPECIES: NAD(P)-dependent alcohol dehydrogenase [unclassified Microbacterium]|uniref:NAD(P)-dependent alcohol dehydrogenase n=1 Tax=unclassified Microbacterium TaxID=2609290 RepID=UPI00214B07EB|nr:MULTISPECIES: NAD(P)-dependent alcohol dehydrogenase [unclassified Microbacterium]MCR2810549.1 NAD(P)-dependent alcohol dehydrogenase [Microbacterium sp. zg.B185]WIM19535.1 NAD(P)-dependent alcohol dehydrogenase [Microbacterium sp. zg-B185]
MSSSITAAVTRGLHDEFELEQLTLDDPRAGEVQVRMLATGVCHTDMAVRDGWIPTTFPIVLGHEGAGVIERVGDGITHLAPGDHVVLTVASCGVCVDCLSGRPSFCADSYDQNFAGGRPDQTTSLTDEAGEPVNSHFFGQSAFATHANVPARGVVKVRADVPLEILAPLGCGVQTGAGTVLNVLQPRTDSTLVVFGAGAVGMSALMAARVARVRTIVAVDMVDERLELARELGATHTVNPRSEDTVDTLAKISGSGVDYAIDTTGNAGVVDAMFQSLGHRGHAILLAAANPEANAPVNLALAVARAIRVTAVVEGGAIPQLFIPELIELYLAGEFPFDKLIRSYPFGQIGQAFHDSESGVVVKPVLTFA